MEKSKYNIRLGRIGSQEGVSILSIALIMNGIFVSETRRLYEHGNSVYITLPLAILAAMLFFFLMIGLMRKAKARDLHQLLKNGLGPNASAVVAIPITLLLLFSAFMALDQFIKAMHGLFFEGASYSKIAVFVIPTVLVIAWLGLETIGRTAKCFAIVLAILITITIIASSAQFDVYRLFPFPGNSIAEMFSRTVEETGLFLPAMTCVLICAEGMNDVMETRKIGLISAAAAAVICFVVQLAIGLVYSYTELSGKLMPLFRINYLNMFEAHLMRMDKLAHIVWLNGAMISAAFYIYSASLLFAKVFTIRDIRPVIAASAAIVMIMILLETETIDPEAFETAKTVIERTSYLILPLMVMTSGLIAVRKTSRKEYRYD